jgi:hypothetical protein
VADPTRLAVVAALPRFSPSALVLKTVAVPLLVVAIDGLAPLIFNAVALPKVTVGEFTAKVPPLEEPRVMFVIVDAPAPVPMFSVFVTDDPVVAPVAILIVWAAVDDVNMLTVCPNAVVFPIDKDVAAPPMFRVVATVLKRF